MFSQVGFRPSTIQNISLATDSDGKLLAISHDNTSQTSDFDEWIESSFRPSGFVYSCPNVHVSQTLARVNFNTPTQMRAPGLASGTFALESAMDELAYALNMDPIELRLKNYSQINEDEKKPYSSKSLKECYQAGAEKFGWSQRNPKPGSMSDGNILIGWGMAGAVYPAAASPSSAVVRLRPDGNVLVTIAAHDLGTGTYTILAQIAAEVLGIKAEQVRVELGDTVLPASPGAGGSRTAATAGSAVKVAAENLIRNIAHYAVIDSSSPLYAKPVEKITSNNGQLILADDPATGEPIEKVFSRNGGRPISGEAQTQGTPMDAPFSGYSWGAQFAEVRIDPMLWTIHVSRWVGAFAAGKILNRKTAASQFRGAIVMGIGMGLLEQSVYDPNRGNFVTASLADYLVPVNADIPNIDIIMVDERDDLINPIGAKGVGELGITGAAAAIANAVYHATGKRVRDLPITLEKIMNV
jgi:xanthine dehydrogenase YagR molybdenum-binding subunit